MGNKICEQDAAHSQLGYHTWLVKSPCCAVKCWVEMPGLAPDSFSWKWCSGINIRKG